MIGDLIVSHKKVPYTNMIKREKLGLGLSYTLSAAKELKHKIFGNKKIHKHGHKSQPS